MAFALTFRRLHCNHSLGSPQILTRYTPAYNSTSYGGLLILAFLLLFCVLAFVFGRQMAVLVLKQISWSQFLLFELEGIYPSLEDMQRKRKKTWPHIFSLANVKTLVVWKCHTVLWFKNHKYRSTILRFLHPSRIFFISKEAKQR